MPASQEQVICVSVVPLVMRVCYLSSPAEVARLLAVRPTKHQLGKLRIRTNKVIL